MIRQYNPQRFQRLTLRGRVVHAGTIAAGEIIRLPDRLCDTRHDRRVMVEAWMPREHTAAKIVDGRHMSSWMRGGHLAVVRSLSDGRRRLVADHWLMEASR